MSQLPATDPGSLSQSMQRFSLQLAEPAFEARVQKYCEILWRENQSLNLTRHLDYDTFVARDLNDVLQVSRLIQPGKRVMDIGSGGGVPGVLLAILRPDLKITLCESMAKKARALECIVRELALPSRIFHKRAESLLAVERFDVCVARAVGPLWKVCNWFQGRWRPMGRLLAFKGSRWKEELEEARRYPSFNQIDWRMELEYPMLGTESTAYILKLWAKGAPEPK